MPIITLTTHISAPIERVFDLSLSVDLHVASMGHTGESAVGEITTGLLKLGDAVTWRARHLGVRQRLTSKITALDRPLYFRDSMVRGAFSRFDHDHYFERLGAGTIMRDRFNYTSPLGLLGHAADWLFLKRYLTTLLMKRNTTIRRIAETDRWRQFLHD
ncbi:MAG: SRPBCC family protein [Candidatus Kapaibacterium sp.]